MISSAWIVSGSNLPESSPNWFYDLQSVLFFLILLDVWSFSFFSFFSLFSPNYFLFQIVIRYRHAVKRWTRVDYMVISQPLSKFEISQRIHLFMPINVRLPVHLPLPLLSISRFPYRPLALEDYLLWIKTLRKSLLNYIHEKAAEIWRKYLIYPIEVSLNISSTLRKLAKHVFECMRFCLRTEHNVPPAVFCFCLF